MNELNEGSATRNPTKHASSMKSTLTQACVEATEYSAYAIYYVAE